MTKLTPTFGPYMGVEAMQTRGNLRFVMYNAFNTYGLIGTEYNGIAVLNDRLMDVVTDNMGIGQSTQAKKALFELLTTADPATVVSLINDSARNRYTITEDEVTA